MSRTDVLVEQARYIALTTNRKDGREVRTPTWMVHHDGKVYVRTASTTGKAKRIRATGRARFAPCDMSGRKILGPWREAIAHALTDPAQTARIAAMFREKYGWQYFIAFDILYRLRGLYRHRVIFELEPVA
ncbi:MAG: PPOX class F420-dependent oxidoreductase [Candidatus Lambdaproteobacteria bacterium]|nr:PPOX class F420-dependent oxidoreductase [Candidatus Lambdaproteobacteria bacterium]